MNANVCLKAYLSNQVVIEQGKGFFIFHGGKRFQDNKRVMPFNTADCSGETGLGKVSCSKGGALTQCREGGVGHDKRKR